MILCFVILVLLIVIFVGALYFKNYKETVEKEKIQNKRPKRYEQTTEIGRQSEMKLKGQEQSEELQIAPDNESQEHKAEFNSPINHGPVLSEDFSNIEEKDE